MLVVACLRHVLVAVKDLFGASRLARRVGLHFPRGVQTEKIDGRIMAHCQEAMTLHARLMRGEFGTVPPQSEPRFR